MTFHWFTGTLLAESLLPQEIMQKRHMLDLLWIRINEDILPPVEKKLYQRKLCVTSTFFPSLCSVVLIKCLEIKSVAQVPSSAQKSFLKQIPELSTHPPCNWLHQLFYWVVFKQIKLKLEQRGDSSWSHYTQTGGLPSSHPTDRSVLFPSCSCYKENPAMRVNPRGSRHTLSWKAERSLSPSRVKKGKYSTYQGFSRVNLLPEKMVLETQSLLGIVSDWSLESHFGPSVTSICFGWMGHHIPKSPWHIAFYVVSLWDHWLSHGKLKCNFEDANVCWR